MDTGPQKGVRHLFGKLGNLGNKKVSDTFSASRLGLSGSNARIGTGADTSATLGSASEWIPMKSCNFTFVAKQDSL